VNDIAEPRICAGSDGGHSAQRDRADQYGHGGEHAVLPDAALPDLAAARA
jgi:hypothetical protein